jgi:hypothetical protein
VQCFYLCVTALAYWISMNRLSTEKRRAVIACLVEGNFSKRQSRPRPSAARTRSVTARLRVREIQTEPLPSHALTRA